jgi:hypothetical protein
LIPVRESKQEWGLAVHKLLISNDLRLTPEAPCPCDLFLLVQEQTLCQNSSQTVGFFNKFVSLVDN